MTMMMFALPRQQWLGKRALMLRYMYISCLGNPTNMCVFSN